MGWIVDTKTGAWVREKKIDTFKTAIASAAGNTALWTPAAGKRFNLMRVSVLVTGNAAAAAGGILSIELRDGAATAIGVTFSCFVPAAAGATFGAAWQEEIDLQQGILSSAIDTALNVNLSVALTAPAVVRFNVMGTEE